MRHKHWICLFVAIITCVILWMRVTVLWSKVTRSYVYAKPISSSDDVDLFEETEMASDGQYIELTEEDVADLIESHRYSIHQSIELRTKTQVVPNLFDISDLQTNGSHQLDDDENSRPTYYKDLSLGTKIDTRLRDHKSYKKIISTRDILLGMYNDSDSFEPVGEESILVESQTTKDPNRGPMSGSRNFEPSSVMRWKRPVEVWKVNDVWQRVNDSIEVYLYTAHLDERATLSHPAIRVIAVADTNMTNLHVACLLWYNTNSHPDHVAADIYVVGPRIAPNKVILYEQYIISCNLTAANLKPSHVSVLTGKKMATTILEVLVPIRSQHLLPFGHCMSVVYWKLDPYRLIEWLELHRVWGVSEVNIYTNKVDSDSMAVLSHYNRSGFVVLRELPSILPDSTEATILLNMSPSLNDCLYRNLYRYKKIIVTDFDEMIVPRTHGNYSALISAIDVMYPTDHLAKSYMFRNVYFFTDLAPDVHQPWYLMTSRFLHHVKPSDRGYSAKSITDPSACIGLQNHLCWVKIQDEQNDNWNVDVDTSLGRSHHYKKCHFDDYMGELGVCAKTLTNATIDRTMLRFTSRISKPVLNVLKLFHLVGSNS